MSRRYIFSLYILVAVCLILAFATGFMVNDLLKYRSGDFPLFMEAYEIIEEHGYTALPEEPAVEYGMIRGLINAYGDPFTSFVEPARHELESNNLHGSFGGIGVRLVREPDGSLLLYPYPDGPAALAGIIDADILKEVGELPVTADIPVDEVTAAIRGPEGENVEISVLRGSPPEQQQFSIARESVPLPSVTWHISPIDPSIGILEVNILAASTEAEILTAYEDLVENGATHFILDLRDNSGGLLDAGVDTARLFLSEGVVIEQQFQGENVEAYKVEKPGPLSGIPLIVLVNQNTASAAEILAGAIQNNARAELVGHPSFGKDSIQLVFDLSDESSIHISAARWWLPGAENPLRGGGLLPEIYVEPSDSEFDNTMQEAIERLLTDD